MGRAGGVLFWSLLVSLLGVCLLLFVAVGLSSNRAAIRLRTVLLAFGLQGGIGFVALWTDWGIAALGRGRR